MIGYVYRNHKAIMRHPKGVTQGVRKAYGTHKAMKAHKAKNPCCAACNTKKSIHTHHITPVSVRPDLADDPTNFISLCAKCHFTVGHPRNWKHFRPNVVHMARELNNDIVTTRAYE